MNPPSPTKEEKSTTCALDGYAVGLIPALSSVGPLVWGFSSTGDGLSIGETTRAEEKSHAGIGERPHWEVMAGVDGGAAGAAGALLLLLADMVCLDVVLPIPTLFREERRWPTGQHFFATEVLVPIIVFAGATQKVHLLHPESGNGFLFSVFEKTVLFTPDRVSERVDYSFYFKQL